MLSRTQAITYERTNQPSSSSSISIMTKLGNAPKAIAATKLPTCSTVRALVGTGTLLADSPHSEADAPCTVVLPSDCRSSLIALNRVRYSGFGLPSMYYLVQSCLVSRISSLGMIESTAYLPDGRPIASDNYIRLSKPSSCSNVCVSGTSIKTCMACSPTRGIHCP